MTADGELRLGVLGLSEGNGHPYSWSAIFNGYDPQAMASCPFSAIPEYLARQVFPRDGIPHARVTHVWAQNRTVAEHIAAASLIPHVAARYEDMIGQVDAILLARDDGENHLAMSLPFLDAGLPIYIDKPIALSLDDLRAMYEHQRFPGQIFSCSSMRFAAEFQLDDATRQALGEVTHVQATVAKYWETYGIHLIDPVLNMLGLYGVECIVTATRAREGSVVIADWGTVAGSFTCLGSTPGGIEVRLLGSRGSRTFTFVDSFACFKRALEAFVDGIRRGREMTTRLELESAVSILERGRLT